MLTDFCAGCVTVLLNWIATLRSCVGATVVHLPRCSHPSTLPRSSTIHPQLSNAATFVASAIGVSFVGRLGGLQLSAPVLAQSVFNVTVQRCCDSDACRLFRAQPLRPSGRQAETRIDCGPHFSRSFFHGLPPPQHGPQPQRPPGLAPGPPQLWPLGSADGGGRRPGVRAGCRWAEARGVGYSSGGAAEG